MSGLVTAEPGEIRAIQQLRRSAEHRYAFRMSDEEYAARVRAGLGLRFVGAAASEAPVDGAPIAQASAGSAGGSGAAGAVGVFGAAKDEVPGVDGLLVALKAAKTWGAAFGAASIAQLQLEARGTAMPTSDAEAPADGRWAANGVDALLCSDVWGYLAPGKPSMAAELAWRHLCRFHEKSRLYAGMFVAACVSVAVVADDLLEAVFVGLGEIPDESRLSRAIKATLRIHRTSSGWVEAKERLGAELAGSHHPDVDEPCVALAHGVLALLSGGGDTERTWELLAESGFGDPSMKGALGSIIGVQVGTDGVRLELRSAVPRSLALRIGGVEELALDAMVTRIVSASKRLPSKPG